MNHKLLISRRKFIYKAGTAIGGTLLASPFITTGISCVRDTGQLAVNYLVVVGEEGRFMGWPANNGMWKWDDGREILVGYTDGPHEDKSGHNIGGADYQLTKLARSKDAGITWQSEDPDNFVGDGQFPEPCPGGINFGHPDFALRVAAKGYHGTDDPEGRFFISYDRGKTWQGPWRFNELNGSAELIGIQITSRTCYYVTGPESARLIMSARKQGIEFGNRLDKPFVAETTDGGKTFRFISWIVPWTDNYRAVMPSLAITPGGKLIVAVRRRNPRDNDQACWIDAYLSEDNGQSWSFLSRVGETGMHNGNPAGLALLKDGRLACCFANRSLSQVLLSYSEDEGKSWQEAIVIRDNPLSYDIGYPQLLQNVNGEMVALYYISTEERPHSFIEAAIWKP